MITGGEGGEGDEGADNNYVAGNSGGDHAAWVELPNGDDDSDPRWQQVWQRLGHPKDPKDYKFVDPKDFQLDDAHKEYRESFRGVAHRLKLTQKQVNGLHDWEINNAKLIRQAERDRRDGALTTAHSTLAKEWGQDYKARLPGLNKTAKEHGLNELANTYLKDGRRVGDTLAFVKAVAALSEKAERRASHVDSPAPVIGTSGSQSAKEQIAQITRGALAKGLDPTSKSWPHAQLDPLYKKAHGTRPMRTDGITE